MRYIQGPGVLEYLGKIIRVYGKKVLVISGRNARRVTGEIIERSLKQSDVSYIYEVFSGECSWSEIERLSRMALENNVDVVIGVGGGKAVDTAKAVGIRNELTVVTVPTIASTDAPTSALSAIYTEPYPGEFLEIRFWPKNPDLVLVDTAVVASAPPRFLAAGMGDASSKIWAALVVKQGGGNNYVFMEYDDGKAYTPLKPFDIAEELAKMSWKILRSYGELALESNRHGIASSALEQVVYAITLLSGLAFENGGLAAAHSIYHGLTVLWNEMKPRQYYGELVAFSTLVQLVLEGRYGEAVKYIRWAHSVGLPITLEEIGLKDISDEKLWKVTEKATAPGESIHNEPFEASPDKVFRAIREADILGRKYSVLYPRKPYS